MQQTTRYSETTGIRLLNALRASGKRIFTTEEARAQARRLDIAAATLPWLLHALATGGWVRRLRRGLYAIDESERGGPAPHPFAVATALVAPSAVCHWSALAYHGLTEQIPRAVTVCTPKDILTPSMRGTQQTPEDSPSTWQVAGLKVRIVRLRPAQFWGLEEVWVDEFSRVAITDRERTVLDGFVSPESFGSLSEVLGILEEHLGEIDLPRLASYAIRYGQGAAVKRLGYALEQMGAPEEVLGPLRARPIKGFRLFDPQGPRRGPHVAAWQIRDNVRAVG